MHCDVCRAIGFATEVSCQQVKCKRRVKHNRPKDLVLKVSVLLLLLLFCVFVFLFGGVYNYGLSSLSQTYSVSRITAQNICVSDL